MAKILNIETSTRVCSVSVSFDGEIIAIKESHDQNSHAEQITLFSKKVIKEAQITNPDIDAVAISMGPGSYTGLRIGVSTAKGYCYGLGIPLIAVGTLESMAFGMKQQVTKPEKNALLCPMIDARRMEVYTAMWNFDHQEIKPTEAVIIDHNSFADILTERQMWFGGDGAPKCKDALSKNPNAVFIDDFHPSSAFIGALAELKYQKSQFEDVAYFEPYYLKDFVAGIPKVKGLR